MFHLKPLQYIMYHVYEEWEMWIRFTAHEQRWWCLNAAVTQGGYNDRIPPDTDTEIALCGADVDARAACRGVSE